MSARAWIGHCLARAAQEGYRVGVVDGRVRVRRHGEESLDGRSTVESEVWRAALRALDPRAVASVLIADIVTELDSADADTREAFEERAAILEHDAGLPRAVAERVAWCWCVGATR